MSSVSLPDQVRAACAWVAERARSVRVEESAIAEYASTLERHDEPEADLAGPDVADREAATAFAICLNAINFGSGWWPTIRKRPGHSGYATIAAGVSERFRDAGPWTAKELARIDRATISAAVGQDPEHPLMTHFAAALRDLGARVLADHGGRFEAVADAAGGSAPVLVAVLAGWDAFADVSIYEGRQVPFFKRAQLAAADLHRTGVVTFLDLDRLTAFADNLVPHVLRVDGVLALDASLTATIEAGQLLAHGSPEEVELRACAVHAVELLAAAGESLTPAEIDAALWNRGRDRRYKALPRPRSRNTAY